MVRQKEGVVFVLVNFFATQCRTGLRGGAVGCVTALQGGRSRIRFPVGSLNFFY